MLDWINTRPFQMVLFFTCISFGTIYVAVNLRNPKRLFFSLLFYIPISFRTSSGTLGMYFALLLYVMFLYYKNSQFNKNPLTIDNLLAVLLLFAATISILTTEYSSFFVIIDGKLRISFKYLYIIAMASNLAVYFLAKKFIVSKEDLIKALKYMVISGTIASLAGYLQLINRGLFVFKYIVLGENPKWSTRIAATMQGYELLAEYTMILIIFTILLLMLARKRSLRLIYSGIILNFVLVLTLTQTRGIYIAVGFSLFYLILLFFCIGKFQAGAKLFMVFVVFLILAIVSIFIIDQLRPDSSFVERFKELSEIDIAKGDFASRTGVWQFSSKKIQDMTTGQRLFGAGYKYLFRGEQQNGYQGWPHSLYFTYILRDGYLGFGLLLIFFIWLYKASITGILHSKYLLDKDMYLISIALHLAFIIFVVDQAKIEFIRHDRTQNIYWLLFGLISVQYMLLKKEMLRKQNQ